ncbi:5-oxoprolinase subunit PxpB [Roseovarius pelagicus]|uniref:5-oxoprolinase subunit PxpB n=1 Tax=Roseovarius pelagicus TaxID=2980108 RepID=A0ABY6D9I3_9RHOB|nr:5-oxoprolinase subunit PxpB [Roseovarius pelagicus]UXX82786.1 5-oxoprolinase subunit PxpB [Roseovarius pelagicus]
MTPSFLPVGDRALLLQVSEIIDAAANKRIIAFAEMLRTKCPAGITEIVPTYGSLLVCYEPEVIRGAALEAHLRGLWHSYADEGAIGRLWHVPCLYGGEVGQDLQELADLKGCSADDLITMHCGAEYRVYMIGFAPGFAYLGGLPKPLHTPRLRVPRQYIPAGAIGIGGQQASINSVAGPSGWRFIGWTPWRNFDPSRSPPFLFHAGDRIRFRPVGADEARDIADQVASGALSPEPEEGDTA